MEDPGVGVGGELVDPELKKSWKEIQECIRHQVVTQDNIVPFEDYDEGIIISDQKEGLVAGLDISYPKDKEINKGNEQETEQAFAAVVICSWPSMEVKLQEVRKVSMDAPYVPGFLAFREFPALSSLLQEVIRNHPDLKPHVILVDGNGLLHPQRCGVACHIGIHFDVPTIGVAKNLYALEGTDVCKKEDFQKKLKDVGDFEDVKDTDGTVLGIALKSAQNAKNPIYVSVGHKISLETARKFVLKCCKFRVPEPLRFADQISREFVRKLEEEQQIAVKDSLKSEVVSCKRSS